MGLQNTFVVPPKLGDVSQPKTETKSVLKTTSKIQKKGGQGKGAKKVAKKKGQTKPRVKVEKA